MATMSNPFEAELTELENIVGTIGLGDVLLHLAKFVEGESERAHKDEQGTYTDVQRALTRTAQLANTIL